jgi:hypothetical protein
MWNNARDGSTPNGYFFVVDQSGAVSSTPDINIKKQAVTTGGGYASQDITSTTGESSTLVHAEVNLDPKTVVFSAAYTQDDLCGSVAHELGHDIGINGIASGTCNSIMDGNYRCGSRNP